MPTGAPNWRRITKPPGACATALAASLIALLLVERVILRRLPAASRWLGLAPA